MSSKNRIKLSLSMLFVTSCGCILALGSPAYAGGWVADAKTGRIPVVVHFTNSHERLRCGVPVSVRFTDQQAVCKR